MAKEASPTKLDPISPLMDLDSEVEAAICQRIAEFKGDSTVLEAALGSLILGQHFGYRGLRMIHNPSTYRKYERILGISFQDVVPERTHLSRKLTGIKIADELGKFWDIVMGRTKVAKKGELTDG